MSARASAPASSANLGAGFDCLALALDIRCTVEATDSDRWQVEHRGAERPLDDSDLIYRVAADVSDERPLRLVVDNAIPITRGLGSSAAAIAATAAAVAAVRGRSLPADQAFALVRKWEGHPDNAAATVLGGLVAVGADGVPRSLELHPSLRPVVAVPDVPLSTQDARRALPASVPLAVASRSGARVVALIDGLRLGDPDRLGAALGDELHQPHREVLFPLAGRLIAGALESGALYAALSGAGSSVLALTTDDRLPAVAGALGELLDDGGRVMTPAVAAIGLS